MNLLRNVELEKGSTITQESTTIKSRMIDRAGFEGVMFVLIGSTLMGGVSFTMRAQHNTVGTTVGANYVLGTVTCTGLAAAGVNNRIAVLDVYRPTKQFVRAVITGTSSGQGELLAIKYGPKTPGTTALTDSTHFAGGGVVVGASS